MMKQKTNRGLARMTWALVVALVLAICMSCVAMAAEAKTFEQTLHVKQSVTGNASRTTYTYELVPVTEGAPLPDDAKEGAKTYTFVMDGDSKVDLKMHFPADVAKDYKYELNRVEEVPAGDTVTPDTHLFGYLVEQDDNGEWIIIPYTCYNNEFKISTDENGKPTEVTLEENKIVGTKGDQGDKGDKGDQGDKGEPGRNGNDGQNGTNGTDGKNGTNGTNGRNGTDGKNGTNGTNGTNVVTRTVNRVVNTGDPYQIGIWVVVLALSLAALIIVAAIRRKKERDEENS